MKRNSKVQGGFTLVEMIVVMVITGIIGGIVAMFIQAPVKQYVDIGRRAEMTDIADLALRRMARDLRMALPNSVRVTVMPGNVTYLEFIPTTGGGRYRAEQSCPGAPAPCVGNALNFAAPNLIFDVIGPMPPAFAGGESIVVYNMGTLGLDAYAGANRTTTPVAQVLATNSITIGAPGMIFPMDSCQNDLVTGLRVGCRFQVITTPVTYVCAPGPGGTLTRYWGYPIAAAQPTAVATLLGAGASSALLATNVSGCIITYSASVVAVRSGLVTMSLSITEADSGGVAETVTLYSSTHVTNVP